MKQRGPTNIISFMQGIHILTHLTRGMLVALSAIALTLSGCSENEAAAYAPYPDMPADLRQLQGTWAAADTNRCTTCEAVFQGYTIRIRYQEEPDDPMIKQNVSISRLDDQRNLLIINGGAGAWPYDRSTQDELELEFFNDSGWHKLSLRRDKR